MNHIALCNAAFDFTNVESQARFVRGTAKQRCIGRLDEIPAFERQQLVEREPISGGAAVVACRRNWGNA